MITRSGQSADSLIFECLFCIVLHRCVCLSLSFSLSSISGLLDDLHYWSGMVTFCLCTIYNCLIFFFVTKESDYGQLALPVKEGKLSVSPFC